MLNKTNSVLYGEESLVDSVFVTSDFGVGVSEVSEVSAMAENTNGAEPTNRDLMDLLKNVSGRLETVEKRLGAMEAIEKRVWNIEKDMKKRWVALEDKVKKVGERVERLENKVDGTDIHVAELSERVQELEKERESLRDDVSYHQSESMRNNLIFKRFQEDNTNGNEAPEITERKLRQHLQDAFKITREIVDSIRFERVHRSPGYPIAGKVRNIVLI